MPEAVIVDAIRTPIGRAFKGSLKDVRADDLAAVPLKALVDRNPDVDFGETADIMMGNANGAGEQGYNIGRNAGLLSGIDHHVPACTLNRFCASSLQTLRMAFTRSRPTRATRTSPPASRPCRAPRAAPTSSSTRSSTAAPSRSTTSTSRWA